MSDLAVTVLLLARDYRRKEALAETIFSVSSACACINLDPWSLRGLSPMTPC